MAVHRPRFHALPVLVAQILRLGFQNPQRESKHRPCRPVHKRQRHKRELRINAYHHFQVRLRRTLWPQLHHRKPHLHPHHRPPLRLRHFHLRPIPSHIPLPHIPQHDHHSTALIQIIHGIRKRRHLPPRQRPRRRKTHPHRLLHLPRLRQHLHSLHKPKHIPIQLHLIHHPHQRHHRRMHHPLHLQLARPVFLPPMKHTRVGTRVRGSPRARGVRVGEGGVECGGLGAGAADVGEGGGAGKWGEVVVGGGEDAVALEELGGGVEVADVVEARREGGF
mmetsp:Transcript_19321/g.48328  ORF Transcript_19321/g.48328 Transcript_19321/m.48328 type:complete len:277 (+) Transcript_19321:790-1620(+)